MGKKNNLKSYFLIGLLLFAIILGGAYYFSVTGTILSVDEVSFSSSSSWWSGQTWIVQLTQYGMGQYIEGGISAEDMQDEANAPILPERNLEVKLLNTKQTCEWTATSDKVMYNYGYNTWETWLPICSDDDGRQKCGTGYIATITEPGLSFPKKCMCLWQRPFGWTGVLSGESIRTTSTLEVTAEGKTESVEIDTKGSSSGFLGNNLYYSYNGDLLLSSCTSQSPDVYNYKPIYKGGDWYFTRDYKLTQYEQAKTNWNNYYQNYIADGKWLESNWDAQTIRNYMDNVQRSLNSMTAESTGGYFQANTYYKDLVSPVTNPTYTLWIKATWLGIVQPDPDIRIKSASCDELGSSGSGVCRVTFQNYGESGEATVWVEVDYPFYSSDRKIIEVSGGGTETEELEITISASYDDEAEDTAVIYVQNSGGERYSKSVTLRYVPTKLCDFVGATVCRDDKIMDICSNVYEGWKYYKTCENDETCQSSNGVALCIKSDAQAVCGNGVCEEGENAFFCPQDCGDDTDDSWLVWVLLFLVVGVMGVVFFIILLLILRTRN